MSTIIILSFVIHFYFERFHDCYVLFNKRSILHFDYFFPLKPSLCGRALSRYLVQHLSTPVQIFLSYQYQTTKRTNLLNLDYFRIRFIFFLTLQFSFKISSKNRVLILIITAFPPTRAYVVVNKRLSQHSSVLPARVVQQWDSVLNKEDCGMSKLQPEKRKFASTQYVEGPFKTKITSLLTEPLDTVLHRVYQNEMDKTKWL